jgi:hypothetical protein
MVLVVLAVEEMDWYLVVLDQKPQHQLLTPVRQDRPVRPVVRVEQVDRAALD